MSNTKEVQHRIKSVNNIAKITRAMEMVAAAKMRRAIEAVLKTRSYADLSWMTILNLTADSEYAKLHPLLVQRSSSQRVAIILFAANGGLCGSFSSVLLNKVQASILKHQINEQGEPVAHEFLICGKRGAAVSRRYGHKIAAEFVKKEVIPDSGEVAHIAKLAISEFLAGHYDKVLVAYTDFVSVSVLEPRLKQLLPIDLEAVDDHLGVVGEKRATTELGRAVGSYNFTYEPNPLAILDKMIPRLIEVQLLQALLESSASEHSARMTAMHQATEAAGDLVGELTLSYNKMRQAGITAEIAEIAAGAQALN
jgi:F-type H+-transporting ATPase subunit gamma